MEEIEDPLDINNGSDYIFLKTDATEIMRYNKRKVKYIFEGEEENYINQNHHHGDAVMADEDVKKN